MKNVLLAAIIIFSLTGISSVYSQSRYHKEIPLSDENLVNVRLESAYGTVNIRGNTVDKVLIADMIIEPSLEMISDINYRIDNKTGLLNLNLRPTEKTKRGWGVRNPESGVWDLRFNKEIPHNFDIELGAGRGTFDFTGMHLNNLNLSAGASAVTVRFDEPNTGFIDMIRIESGVSRFNGEKLGNANFRLLQFEGGVGSYTLDFDGDHRHEANVNVELGIGAVTLIIPDHIGVKLHAAQRLFSSVSVPDDFERIERDQYISKNYNTAEGKLNIKIESGFGSVRVRR